MSVSWAFDKTGTNADIVGKCAQESDGFGNETNDDRSCCSEDSEIAQLQNVSISDDLMSSNSNARNDKTLTGSKNLNEALYLINTAKSMNATSIDISKKNLITIPDPLLQLSRLEYMYMEGNKLQSLPDDFFKMFPHLRWLDLRNNLLSKLPSAHLSSHNCLRNILLEGNNLSKLPMELGLVKTLHGLNIFGNPLDFPPQEIIEKGTQHVLSFLRDVFNKKISHKSDLDLNLSENVLYGLEQVSASSDDWNTTASMMDLARKRETMLTNKLDQKEDPEEHFENTNLVNFKGSSNNAMTKHQNLNALWKTGQSEAIKKNTSLMNSSNLLKIEQVNISKRVFPEDGTAIIRFFKTALRD